MKIIFDYNRTIFDPETDDLYPGVLDLLKRLFQENELFLVSRNEPERKNRVRELGIEKYFQEMLFVDEKTEGIFAEIAADSKMVVVVGDSIRDEIRIGNLLGFVTVRVAKGIFKMQKPEDENQTADYEIADIRELEKIIKSYEK